MDLRYLAGDFVPFWVNSINVHTLFPFPQEALDPVACHLITPYGFSFKNIANQI